MRELEAILNPAVNEQLKKANISLKTGFLHESPILAFPPDFKNPDRAQWLQKIYHFAFKLPEYIQKKRVISMAEQIPVPQWTFDDLPWNMRNLLFLEIEMIVHAFFHELLGYKTVDELKQDRSIKILPPQLAIPSWQLSKMADTEIDSSMSYGLYSLPNWRRKNPFGPFSLENFEMIHSFTGGLDEIWFVIVHHIVEFHFAPAIVALRKASLLADALNSFENKKYVYEIDSQPQRDIVKHVIQKGAYRKAKNYLADLMGTAATSYEKSVATLQRMREHCDHKRYFNQVRILYMFPTNVVFRGISDVPMEIFGETGGQSPYIHFLIKVLGIRHKKSAYFDLMREKHVVKCFRDFINSIEQDALRTFVIQCHDKKLKEKYNSLLQLLVGWREEHRALVTDYIQTQGDSHGTGKPPIDWLDELIAETKEHFVV